MADGALSDEAASLDLAVDFAFGTMWYRLISHHAPVDTGLAEQITAALTTLLRPGAAAPPKNVKAGPEAPGGPD